MPLFGDFRELDRWHKRLGDLASASFLRAVTREIGNEALTLVKAGFSSQSDPYGKPWKAKKNRDGKPILVGKTRQLRKFRLKVLGSMHFELRSGNPDVFAFHQSGTGLAGPSRKKYEIHPIAKSWLRWQNGGRGEYTFAKKVMHPGVTQRLMVPLTSRAIPPKWSTTFGRAWTRMVKAQLRK